MLTACETDTAGALTAEMLSGADGMISMTDHSGASPLTSYYHYNPHGDTSAITDASGAVTGTYRYDAFGNELTASDTTYGYTGKWQRDTDSATKMIRMGVREYDPALGRFISVDPLKGDPTDSQQRNRYQYTGNNPLVRYDLNGLYWGEDWLKTTMNTIQWATGTGPEERHYGPDDIQTQNLMDSPGVQRAKDRFYSINKDSSCSNPEEKCGVHKDLPRHGVGFGPSGAWGAGFNPTKQFVGGYDIEIKDNGDCTMTITIYNDTDMGSALYHVYPDWLNYGRVNIGPFEISPPGSTVSQTYTWTAQIQ